MTVIGKRFHPILLALSTGDRRLQQAILRHSPDALIRLLAQSAANILVGNIKLSPHQKRRLGKFKLVLRKLQRRGVPLSSKRRLLINQRGGFLSLLLPIISAAVGGLVGRVLNKK